MACSRMRGSGVSAAFVAVLAAFSVPFPVAKPPALNPFDPLALGRADEVVPDLKPMSPSLTIRPAVHALGAVRPPQSATPRVWLRFARGDDWSQGPRRPGQQPFGVP
jgi:hypothetical protein